MGELNITGNKEFLKFLLPPGELTDADAAALNYLLLKYPYCQPLHYAYAASLKKTDNRQYEEYLQKASVYSPKRDVLKRFIDSEGSFHLHDLTPGYGADDEVIYHTISDTPRLTSEPMVPAAETLAQTSGIENDIETIISDAEAPVLLGESENILNDETEATSSIDSTGVAGTGSSDDGVTTAGLNQDGEPAPSSDTTGAAEAGSSEDDLMATAGPEEDREVADAPETVIPDAEVPDEELTEVEQRGRLEGDDAELQAPGQAEEDLPETIIPSQEDPAEEIKRLEESMPPENHEPERAEAKIALESVASSDYFVFNRSAIDPLQSEQPAIKGSQDAQALGGSPEKTEVSRYDDDTMPYSFLWWLHKTRMEHASTYQPYVRPLTPSYKTGELNQQIIENIFHIQPELNTFQTQAATVEFELRKKEDIIIEKFIKEEPQIRPPQANRLDTENKARKSSEDNLDLVSETLAKIYTDQMLYHKAIETYKKLSLKFPEKKLYFAGQIEELEKKIS